MHYSELSFVQGDALQRVGVVGDCNGGVLGMGGGARQRVTQLGAAAGGLG